MSKKIVVILRSDPRVSHRACEGIRIALGLVSGGHQLEVIFSEKSYFLLTDTGDEMVDGERAVQFLDTLKMFIPLFLIDKKATNHIDLEELDYESQFISREKLALKISVSDCLLRF